MLKRPKSRDCTATKGDAGKTADSERWPQKELASIRENELKECLCNIGDIEQFWLEHNDGEMMHADSESAVDELVRILNVFKPDTVITFEPNGITGHDDHKTISLWTSRAVRKSDMRIRVLHSMESQEKYDEVGKDLDNEFNIYFNVDKPNCVCRADADVCFELPEEFKKIKLAALKAHESQTSRLFASFDGKQAVKALAATECYVYV